MDRWLMVLVGVGASCSPSSAFAGWWPPGDMTEAVAWRFNRRTTPYLATLMQAA
jgi:hypothetical protein